ncbi:glycoside hydrolase N-terminal domain-containing protein [Evansella sp. AB-rgal1]|uniref:glycosyl hydrolase family 95 catalytic domain-containing protein n=1 Tax=Evansella sp. AB-rgal1 TaxID=3242696 RepID=UPI00359E6B26
MPCTDNNRNKLVLKYPASWWRNMWREALPSGNGKIGAAVYGGVNLETVLINHEELWHGGKKDELPEVSHTLRETRRLIEEEKYQEANWNLTKSLKEKGYSTQLSSILPLVDLKVRMHNKSGFHHYRRVLDMETGEIHVSWKEENNIFMRSLFVSRADDVIVYEINSTELLFSADFQFKLHKSDSHKMENKIKQLEKTVQIKTEDNFLYYSATNDDNTDYGAVIRIVPTGGECLPEYDSICCKNTSKVVALIKVFVKSDYKKEWPKLRSELLSLDPIYKGLLGKHVLLHQELFHSASLFLDGNDNEHSNEQLLLDAYEGEVSTTLVEKMWSYGRYLFISGTREEGQPFGMYGLWGGDYNLMWCHRMANENIQMMYWHANVGGLTDSITTLFYYYKEMINDFRDSAKKLYGCRGIYIPAGTTPNIGIPNQIVPVIMNWTGAAGWLAQHFYDYYLYTGDKDFLTNQLLPYMREVALFYQDFLVLGDDNQYDYLPSVSPENTPQNFMPKDGNPIAHPMPTTINATMDIAIVKELLTNLVEGCREGSVYLDEIRVWEEMISRLPEYTVTKDGAIEEWLHPAFEERNDHRHLSHIYPLFPGNECMQKTGTHLFGAFKKAVENRVIGAQTGWSFMHMACIYARLHEGNKALQSLEYLSRSCLLNNFYTLHNDWRNMGLSMEIETAPIQMDANMGWVNAVQEMLLFVSKDMLKVLPALPDKWKKGSVRDFRFCTGKISFSWDVDTNFFQASLVADRKTKTTLQLPSVFTGYDLIGDGVEISNSSLGGSYYDVEMYPNQKVMISTT